MSVAAGRLEQLQKLLWRATGRPRIARRTVSLCTPNSAAIVPTRRCFGEEARRGHTPELRQHVRRRVVTVHAPERWPRSIKP
jgi:hypothetical protein